MNRNQLLDIIQSLYICPTNKLKIERFLDVLSLDDKIYLAGNIKTPPDILAMLANDENHYIRECVAYNKSTPIVTLQMLAKDKSYWVRCYVAQNTSTPATILEILAADTDSRTRDIAAMRITKEIK